MRDDLYAAHRSAQLVAPMRQSREIRALPLTDFEWLNAGLLVRHRQREARPRPLFVARPARRHGRRLAGGRARPPRGPRRGL